MWLVGYPGIRHVESKSKWCSKAPGTGSYDAMAIGLLPTSMLVSDLKPSCFTSQPQNPPLSSKLGAGLIE
jgi:hypothetical protein